MNKVKQISRELDMTILGWPYAKLLYNDMEG